MARHAARLFLGLAAALGLCPASASAQGGVFGGLTKSIDTTFSVVTTVRTDASGTVTRSEATNLYPRLTLNVDTRIWPSLSLSGGGIFEVNQLSSVDNGSVTDSTLSSLRPFILLRSTNPVLSPGLGYFRRESRASPAGLPTLKFVSEDYEAYLGWKPEGLPRSDIQLLRTNNYDSERLIADTTDDVASLISKYNGHGFGANYRGYHQHTRNRREDLESWQTSHALRVDYSSRFLGDRGLWSGFYDVSHASLRTSTGEDGGEVSLPLVPFAGMAALSDTPAVAALSPNPLLIDANLGAGAGVDIGLPAPGENAQARNLGLDFLSRTEVTSILVWVDRELPAVVAASYRWEVYASTDNLTWRREVTVTSAPFGPFENRFEISFSAVTARYLKVVTAPLSMDVPDAARFPDIFVTELQAFVRRSVAEGGDRFERTTHNVNADARFRILNVPQLYYEGYYLYRRDARGQVTDTLSNGASINQAFGRIFSLHGRGALEQGTERDEHRSAALSNVVLTAAPVGGFTGMLLYTRQDERVGSRETDYHAVSLQNQAKIYSGIDVVFGIGWNARTDEFGVPARGRLLNASGTVTPYERTTLTFSYSETSSERADGPAGSSEYDTRSAYVTLAVDPVPTLHVVLGEEVIAVTDQETRLTHAFNVSWMPFPDGALQIQLAYDEALRDLAFGTSKGFLGSVRWNLHAGSYVTLSYQRTRSEFAFSTVETRVLSCEARLYF